MVVWCVLCLTMRATSRSLAARADLSDATSCSRPDTAPKAWGDTQTQTPGSNES